MGKVVQGFSSPFPLRFENKFVNELRSVPSKRMIQDATKTERREWVVENARPYLATTSQSTRVTVHSYKLRYLVGFGLVEIAISTNPKPTTYRNLFENTSRKLLFGLTFNCYSLIG